MIATFTDKLGRAWELPAEFDLFQRVKAQAGVDLLDLATTQASLEQLRDPYTLAQALAAATEPAARARGVTPEQFAAGIDGDTLRSGCDALVDAAVFFSPSRARTILTAIVQTAREAEEKMAAATLEKLEEIKTATAAALETLTQSSANSTSSPGSSACTPAGGASGRSTGRRGAGSRKPGNKRAR